MMTRRIALIAGSLLLIAGLGVRQFAACRAKSPGRVLLADSSGQTVSTVAAAVQAEEPVDQALLDAMVGETWFRLNALGQTVGYAYLSSDFDEDDGEQVFKTVNETLMVIAQGEQALESKSVLTVYHDANFTPLRFLFTSDLFGMEQQVEAALLDGHLHVKSTTGGHETQATLAVSDRFGSEVEITRAAVEGRLRAGEQFAFETFNPATASLDQVTVTVGDIETVHLPDGPVPARALQVHSSALGVTSTEWIAEPAEVVKLAFPVLGASMVKVTEEEALKGFSPLKIAESIPVSSRILRVKQVRRLVLDVASGADDIADIIPEDTRQRLVEHDGGSGTLHVRTVEPAGGSTSPLPIEDDSLAPYLRSTEYVQPDDPGIAAAAEKAVGGEQDAWQAAKTLVRWVYDTVDQKDREPAPVTSKHVLATKTGDCTEHTVLFVAVARAVGLPAKFCAGIAMSDGAFYYHAWPEVYVGDAGWIAVDPTWNEAVADATHVKLGEGSLDQQSFARICLAAGRAMGNLDLTIREYELSDGTTHRPE